MALKIRYEQTELFFAFSEDKILYRNSSLKIGYFVSKTHFSVTNPFFLT